MLIDCLKATVDNSKLRHHNFSSKNISKILEKKLSSNIDNFTVFEGTFRHIADIFRFVTDTILSVLDIFVGIFTGDWSRVWDGIKGIFVGVWKYIKATLKNVMKTLCSIFGTSLDEVKRFWVDV